VREAKGLRDEFGVNQPSRSGLYRQMVLLPRRALLFDSRPHSGDFLLPLRPVRREWLAGLAEIGESRRQFLKLLSDCPLTRDGARAGETLNLPEHRAATVIIFVSRNGVYEQSLLAIRTQPRVNGKRE